MSTSVNQTPQSNAAAWDVEFLAPAKSLPEMLLSVGHQLGLFEALAALGKVTAPALARCTGTDEGFLCEWLEAMVYLGQIEFDPATACFAFPRQVARGLNERQGGGPS